jgi:hypothetical protein
VTGVKPNEVWAFKELCMNRKSFDLCFYFVVQAKFKTSPTSKFHQKFGTTVRDVPFLTQSLVSLLTHRLRTKSLSPNCFLMDI